MADEVVVALNRMKNCKALVPGRRPIELIKNAPEDVFEKLVWIFTKCLNGEEILYKWKQVNITLLYKKGNQQNMRIILGLVWQSLLNNYMDEF